MRIDNGDRRPVPLRLTSVTLENALSQDCFQVSNVELVLM